jgi:hypothetical protein
MGTAYAQGMDEAEWDTTDDVSQMLAYLSGDISERKARLSLCAGANVPARANMSPTQWDAYCLEKGLLAFAAEEEGELVGLALAESEPQALHVVAVEGRADAFRLLLEKLVRLSGERDVTAWCSQGKHNLQVMLEGLGFRWTHAAKAGGRTSYFYRLIRNGEV